MVYAFDAVDDALEAVRSFLLPFEFRRWLRLGVVTLFLGGTGLGFPSGLGDIPSDGGGAGGEVPPLEPGVGDSSLLLVLGAIVALLVLVALLVTFVGSVMEFVLVAILNDEEVAVRRNWSDQWRQGLRLFGFRIGLGLLTLLVVGVLVALALLPVITSGGDPLQALGSVLVVLPVVLLVALVSGLVNTLTTAFVVPVMFLEGCGVVAGWRRVYPVARREWKETLAFLLMQVVLSIAAGIAVSLTVGLVLVAVLIPTAIIGAIGAVLFFAVPPAGAIVLALLAVAFIAAMLATVMLVKAPVRTLLRYYSLFVVGDLDDRFDAIPAMRERVAADGSGGGDDAASPAGGSGGGNGGGGRGGAVETDRDAGGTGGRYRDPEERDPAER